MNLLFIHQNFPGQFKHLAPALAAQPGISVTALTMRPFSGTRWRNIRIAPYSPNRRSTPGIHPWVIDFETKVIRAEACFRAALRLKDKGYEPDAIIAHPGWGESLFLKEVWPKARLGLYCEFHYQPEGADQHFDPEFSPKDPGEICRLHIKTVNALLHFKNADSGLSPTRWQADTFPEPFRSRITVVHDGIDTKAVAPNPKAGLKLDNGLTLTKGDEIITFVNRNLEPYRGYHIFMRALPEILRQRPNARVIIVGGDEVSYGALPPQGTTWKDHFINEVRHRIPDKDWERVVFTGKLPYPEFISLLQVSTVHVYLTYPFVISWSLLEAMSAGCAVVAGDVPPVREVIRHDHSGLFVDFFDTRDITEAVCRLLEAPDTRARLGGGARALIQQKYDLSTVCLPRQVAWVKTLANGK